MIIIILFSCWTDTYVIHLAALISLTPASGQWSDSVNNRSLLAWWTWIQNTYWCTKRDTELWHSIWSSWDSEGNRSRNTFKSDHSINQRTHFSHAHHCTHTPPRLKYSWADGAWKDGWKNSNDFFLLSALLVSKSELQKEPKMMHKQLHEVCLTTVLNYYHIHHFSNSIERGL